MRNASYTYRGVCLVSRSYIGRGSVNRWGKLGYYPVTEYILLKTDKQLGGTLKKLNFKKRYHFTIVEDCTKSNIKALMASHRVGEMWSVEDLPTAEQAYWRPSVSKYRRKQSNTNHRPPLAGGFFYCANNHHKKKIIQFDHHHPNNTKHNQAGYLGGSLMF